VADATSDEGILPGRAGRRLRAHRLWPLVVTAVSATVLANVALAVVPAIAESRPLSSVLWQPCGEEDAVECAVLRVDIDHDLPAVGQTQVALRRYAATGPTAEWDGASSRAA
jgi:hypothetical protein